MLIFYSYNRIGHICLMQSVKARSHFTGRCKKDTKRKNILQSVEKRNASVVYSLHTFFIRSTHHCDFIRLKRFVRPKTDHSAVNDVSLQYIRYTIYIRSINCLCPLTFVKRLRYPFCFHLASSQLTSTAPENGEREER